MRNWSSLDGRTLPRSVRPKERTCRGGIAGSSAVSTSPVVTTFTSVCIVSSAMGTSLRRASAGQAVGTGRHATDELQRQDDQREEQHFPCRKARGEPEHSRGKSCI